jgi:hypothetical protein
MSQSCRFCMRSVFYGKWKFFASVYAFTLVQLRSLFFWDVELHPWVTGARHSETAWWLHLQELKCSCSCTDFLCNTVQIYYFINLHSTVALLFNYSRLLGVSSLVQCSKAVVRVIVLHFSLLLFLRRFWLPWKLLFWYYTHVAGRYFFSDLKM